MPRILLTTCCPHWPIARQTPGGRGVWEDFEFIVDEEGVECDAWVVFENPLKPVVATTVPENTFFISGEPPEIRTYNHLFLRQFRWVMTCHETSHPGLIRIQQAHPWHIGVDTENQFKAVLDFDALLRMPRPKKDRLISAVISNKTMTPAHHHRLAFVKLLKQRLGDDFHIYGRGHEPVADKLDAIAPYRFHLALENARLPHYMTEKITDAFLGYSFPFYFGDPSISEYFPEGSFVEIDILRPDDAIESVCRAIEENLDVSREALVREARDAVLKELNMFPMLARILREKMVQGQKKQIRLFPKRQRVSLTFASVKRHFLRSTPPAAISSA